MEVTDVAASAHGRDPAVKSGEFRLPVDDGVELFAYRWLPSGSPKAVVQIAHGMAEHAGRYAPAAAALTDAGYAVYAADHRGHGRTALAPGDLGYFGDRNGWLRTVDDLYAVRRFIGDEHAEAPVFALGHSMGAIMVEHYLFSHGDSIDGAVLSGSGSGRTLRATGGTALAWAERARLGPRGRSWLLKQLTFGNYNREFRPARTEFDWLSSDPEQVDRYVEDPLCGFPLTVQGWIDVLSGAVLVERASNLRRIPQSLPIYLFSGELDPVGSSGRGVRRLARAYRGAGLLDVTERLYPGGRHEMLNETNRDEVLSDLIAWLDRALHKRGRRA